nr:MAG TPA: hypothetical protein [Caudoviricetes sp.]
MNFRPYRFWQSLSVYIYSVHMLYICIPSVDTTENPAYLRMFII